MPGKRGAEIGGGGNIVTPPGDPKSLGARHPGFNLFMSPTNYFSRRRDRPSQHGAHASPNRALLTPGGCAEHATTRDGRVRAGRREEL
mmetsp:Transcript_3446/g.12745  ORF Transcript_3446/g.12745 Transcript_3446/m.12745 type:complete len:88 (-) Transcript_3446:7-270(-)